MILNLVFEMDKSTNDNRTKQCNPTHSPSGPGRDAGYDGNRDKATMDNKSNQQNTNNSASNQRK